MKLVFKHFEIIEFYHKPVNNIYLLPTNTNTSEKLRRMDVLQKYQNEARSVNFNSVLSTTLCSYKSCYLNTVVITIEYN